MVSSTLLNSVTMLKDTRDTLYYGKYRYRARLTLNGIGRTWNADSVMEVVKRIRKYGSAKDLKDMDLDSLERFIVWRNKYATPLDKADKKVTIRIEGRTAGIFGNDLQLLQTLEIITGSHAVDYTEVDSTTPTGIKYFVKEPTHKYRVYLKSKQVEEKFVTDLSRFIDRYKGTDTVIVASSALDSWLNRRVKHWLYRYCSSHYYIEYDDDSTHSLLGLMFGDMIKRRYKLEKRPD